MITAVDSNVLLDIFAGQEPSADRSVRALTRALGEGHVIVGDVVWAEIAAWFGTEIEMAHVMERLGVGYDPPGAPVAQMAGRMWRRYGAGGGTRGRLVPDFLVGAHALVQADRLLSRDRGFFRRYLGELHVIDPSAD